MLSQVGIAVGAGFGLWGRGQRFGRGEEFPTEGDIGHARMDQDDDTVDATSGARASTLDYQPYGYDLRSNTAAGYDPPDKRFAGMVYQWPLQRYLTEFRVYDAGTGQWQSRDPIREAGSG